MLTLCDANLPMIFLCIIIKKQKLINIKMVFKQNYRVYLNLYYLGT